ncbi:TNF receptor-associated factor 4-like isoform X2 [Montipora foliosa]|uniref:TNF receptor-associated factor 4-like isoform X2 n=1 Tax=Montipora foliosa TaxID=591990 RepID=UPI0035F1732C
MSGYDYVFVSSVPEDELCPICSSPLKEPVQTRCGHRFCSLCLEKSMKRMPVCPIDRRSLDSGDIFPDRATERKILDYQVKCPSENDSCQWIGELRNIEAHKNSCPFVPVSCTNELCEVSMLQSELQHHLDMECPRRLITCQYCQQNYVWCDEEVPRSALERHLQASMETHLSFACQRLQELQNKLVITDKRFEELEAELVRNNDLEELRKSIMEKIGRLEASLSASNKTEIANTNRKVEKVEAACFRKQQENDEFVENTRRILEELQREVDVVKRRLQEQLSTPVGTGTEPRPGTSLKRPTMLTPTAPPYPRPAMRLPRLDHRIKKAGYERLPETMEDGSENMNDDSQQNALSINPPNAFSQELSPEIYITNKFIWKITQFDDCLQKAKNDSRKYLLSDLFQSGPYGYRMCAEVHPNGLNEGQDTHLSIFVCLLKGEYDDILPWPFSQKVKITLMDQQPNTYLRRNIQMTSLPRNNSHLTRCYSKPSEASPRNVAFGFCKFISQERLKTKRYLVNDTIFVGVEIDPL